MKISEGLTMGSSLTDENMVFLKQLGVNHLTVGIGANGARRAKREVSRVKTEGGCLL